MRETMGRMTFERAVRAFERYAGSVGFAPSTRRGAFVRENGTELLQCFDVQRNKYLDEPTFTINLGIADAAAMERLGLESPDPAALRPGGCMLFSRLGAIMVPPEENLWWDLSESGVAQAITALERYGITAFDSEAPA